MKHAKATQKLADAFRVDHGKSFRLKDYDPAETLGFHSRDHASELLKQNLEKMSDLQDRLYAQDQWAVLLVLQAMDAAGKDSMIKHVMSGVNPQGCQVHSFKQPSTEELDHDFLWRATRALPARGHIGIFNRSYYEEVLVVRVHKELLDRQHLPPRLIDKDVWKDRYQDIRNFETYLTHNGIVVRKFFLHVSKEEQKKRFLARLQEPEKNWKFSEADVAERKYWDDYMKAFEDAIRNTATPKSPWFIVPADHKWFSHLTVSSIIIETLRELKLSYPKVPPGRMKALQAARKALLKEDG